MQLVVPSAVRMADAMDAIIWMMNLMLSFFVIMLKKFLMVNTFVLIVQSAVSQCFVRSECVQSNLQFDCP